MTMERGFVSDRGRWVAQEKFWEGVVYLRVFGYSLPFQVEKKGNGFKIGNDAPDKLVFEILNLFTRNYIHGEMLEIDKDDYLKAT